MESKIDLDELERLKERLGGIHVEAWDEIGKVCSQAADALFQLQAENAALQVQNERFAEEIAKLNDALTKQANAARMGMDAAKKHASQMLEEAARLNAESKPEVIASERAANAILTAENAELRRALEAISQMDPSVTSSALPKLAAEEVLIRIAARQRQGDEAKG